MRTVIFDLDGTLLPIDFDGFLTEYIQSISVFCQDIIDPKLFVSALLQSIEVMMKNDGNKTNEEAFMTHFLGKTGLEKEKVYPLLEKYYLNEFCKLNKYVKKSRLSSDIVSTILKQDWQIVLATNPLFPRLAIEERMRWAGVADFPWLHITTYENSRGCKPQLIYYQEILDKLGLQPEKCWMIGNDTEEDMVAADLGISTYLITDYLIDKRKREIKPHGRGTLQEFAQFVSKGKLAAL